MKNKTQLGIMQSELNLSKMMVDITVGANRSFWRGKMNSTIIIADKLKLKISFSEAANWRHENG